MLSNLGVARWPQSSWKLSRAFGVSNVAVLHRVSDLRSVGASDSEQVALAQGLLAEACDEYVKATGRRLSIEWAMIHDVNDQGNDAGELAQFARPLGAHVNLIPLNPTPGYAVVGSSAARVRRFRDQLEALGVNATVRVTRGADIDAAWGQLAASVTLSRKGRGG